MSPTTGPDRRCDEGQEQSQTDSNSDQNHRRGGRYWGNKIRTKQSHAVRIVFSNVNSLGQSKLSPKMVQLEHCIKTMDIDFMCMAETGVYWSALPAEDRLWERVKHWANDRRIAFGYNIKDPSASRSQYGGTAILGINDMAPKIQSRGRDEKGLGRWCWFRVQGKNKVFTRIISAYCPCQPPANHHGLNTVYAQQLRVLSRDPVKAFWEDLRTELQTWTNLGDNLILSGDWNRSVIRPEMTEYMAAFGLKEAITHVHGQQPPATYQRGSVSIDGIFVSPVFLGVPGGYLEYGTTPGDHRGIWIDIPQETVLGYNMPKIPPKKIRLLQCSDAAGKKRYQVSLHNKYLQNNVYGKILELRNETVYPPPPSLQVKYDRLDTLMVQLKHSAAQKCRKRRTGGKAFSDKLQHARRIINLWSLVKKRLLGCNINARTILRAKKKTNVKNSTVSLLAAKVHLDQAFRHYRAVKAQDTRHRLDFQYRLCEERAKAGNTKVANIIKTHILRERQRKIAMRTKYTLHKNQRCGTTMIQTKHNGQTVDITDKHDMERRIIAENEDKYHQTEERCPLLHGELLRDIGLLGDGPEVENILNGTYIYPSNTSPAVRLWLDNLYIPNRDQREATVQSLRSYRRGWRQAREHTSSGKLHFGFFKADSEHDMLAWANYVMAGIPRTTGMVPSRWKQGTDVMLLKKEGLFLLDKLRTIVLMESDFNFENKRLGREAMNLALQKDMITEEQYSRPGRSAQDNVLNKRLFFDYMRLRRQPFGVCACDLKSCYDRIVHNAAALVLRRVGIRQSDIENMFGTIQNMVHKVRTAFGDSTDTYAADNPEYHLPVQGTCQGNGAAPSIWSIECSTIFEILHSQNLGSKLEYTLSPKSYTVCGFAYVDDCDLVQVGEDVETVFENLQRMVSMWDELMEVTGAAVSPDKCWWYLIDFAWSHGRWKYSDEGEQLTLTVRDKHGTDQTLKYLSCHEAREMLGVFLAPNGQQDTQITHMKTKSEEWGQYIKDGALRNYEAWNALNTTILKSLEYPLAATTLTSTALRGILAPALKAGLQASGFGHSFPRAILYAPHCAQGLGLHNLYHSQGIRHIRDIIDQTWRNTPSEKYLTLNLEAIKLEAGIEGHLFQREQKITWLNTPHQWIIHTLEFCQKYGITFNEPGTILAKKRERDLLLMDAFSLFGFSTSTLQAANRCRMYLKVTTLSDVATADGRALHTNVVSRTPFSRRDRYKWPPQGKPNTADWRQWDAVLHTIVKNSDIFHKGLGPWVLDTEEYLHSWDYFLNHFGDLIRAQNNTWTYFPSSLSNPRFQKFDLSRIRRISQTPPRGTLWRTTVSIRNHTATTHGHTYNVAPMVHDAITHIRDIASSRSLPDAQWACSNLNGKEHMTQLIHAIEANTAIGVSDGSYNKSVQLGSAAWVLTTEAQTWTIEGGGLIPGPPEDNNSFRSEAGGLLGLMLVLRTLTTHVVTGSITIYCDGKSALTRALLDNRYSFKSTRPAFDIISRIIELREHMKFKIIPRHVRGHQVGDVETLTVSEQLNAQMDSRAKRYISEALHQDFQPPGSLPSATYGMIQLQIEGQSVTTQLDTALRTHVASHDAHQWWIAKGRLTKQTVSIVDWVTAGKTMEEASFSRKKFIGKWATKQLPIGQMQKLKRLQDTAQCPRCNTANETISHILRCPHKQNIKLWHRSIRQLDTWLRKTGTDPEITRVIMLALPRWHAQKLDSRFNPITISNQVKHAVAEQHRIGWDNFMSGLISNQWKQCQDMYYKTKKRRNTGQRWAIRLSHHIWDINKRHWDHRNSVRYQQPVQDAIQGRGDLLYACQLELDLGLMELDPVFHHYFDTDIYQLEEETTTYIKTWFATIRRARESSGWTYHEHDKVSDAIRQWVGLSMEKHLRKEK